MIFDKRPLEWSDFVKKSKDQPPCRVCFSIRLFLISVFGLIIVGVIDRQLISGVAQLSPLAISISFISIFGVIALAKAGFEYKQNKSKTNK